MDKEHLGEVERELTSLIKVVQTGLADPKSADNADPMQREALSAAGQNQDQVIGSLERMLAELGQWDSYRRFARGSQLQQSQGEIAAATKSIGEKTLGRDWERSRCPTAGRPEEAFCRAN